MVTAASRHRDLSRIHQGRWPESEAPAKLPPTTTCRLSMTGALPGPWLDLRTLPRLDMQNVTRHPKHTGLILYDAELHQAWRSRDSARCAECSRRTAPGRRGPRHQGDASLGIPDRERLAHMLAALPSVPPPPPTARPRGSPRRHMDRRLSSSRAARAPISRDFPPPP